MADNKELNSPESRPDSSYPGYPPMDPRLLAAMYGMPAEDEIDLLEYWRIIWKKRWLISGVSLAAGLLAVIYSLTLPNIYRADAVIAPVSDDGSQGPPLAGLGGLASMAGISLGRGSGKNIEENLAILQSREFLWSFIKEKNLKPVLFEDAWDADNKSWREEEPTQWEAYRKLSKLLSVSDDKESDLVIVAMEWTDAGIAAVWVNDLLSRLNEHLRQEDLQRSKQTLEYLNHELGKIKVAEMRQALYNLISQEQKKAMLAGTQKEYAFRVVDAAVAPDKKTKPKRALIVIAVSLIAGILAVVFVLIGDEVRKRKEK